MSFESVVGKMGINLLCYIRKNRQAGAAALYQTANKEMDDGRWGKALKLYNEALIAQREFLGQDHPDAGRTLNAIGVLLMNIGESAHAQTAFLESLYIRKKELQRISNEVLSLVSEDLEGDSDSPARNGTSLAKEFSSIELALQFMSFITTCDSKSVETVQMNLILAKKREEISFGLRNILETEMCIQQLLLKECSRKTLKDTPIYQIDQYSFVDV